MKRRLKNTLHFQMCQEVGIQVISDSCQRIPDALGISGEWAMSIFQCEGDIKPALETEP